MNPLKEFIQLNFKSIMIVLTFLVTMYIQHLNNTAHIVQLENKCTALELKIADQYDKIDAIKLDKAVFEVTMTQFVTIQSDLREMRSDIKELLKSQR